MVVGIANNLKLNLFPTFERLLHEYLRSEGEGASCQFLKLFLVAADARSESAEGVGRANHYREAYAVCCSQRVVHVLHCLTDRSLQVLLVELAHKEVAVLGVHYSLHGSAEHLNAKLAQRAVGVEFRTAVERRLSAKGEQYAVGSLLAYYLCHEMGVDRQEIHLVGNAFRGLYGGDVWVYEHGGDALVAQSLQRLRARVVELASLSDFQCARSEYEHLSEFLFHINVSCLKIHKSRFLVQNCAKLHYLSEKRRISGDN